MKVRLSNWASLGTFSDFIFDNRSLAIKQTKKMAKLQGRPMNLLKRLAQIFRIGTFLINNSEEFFISE